MSVDPWDRVTGVWTERHTEWAMRLYDYYAMCRRATEPTGRVREYLRCCEEAGL